MTLADFADLVESIGIVAIVFGVAFGLIQLRQHRKQSRDAAIIELATSFEDRDFTEAYRLLSELDEGISAREFNALGDDYISALLRVGMKFETVGLLVYKGVVPFDAMKDLVGGAAIKIWRVVENWTLETRETQDHDLLFEWFQWLVERLQERGEGKRIPAFQAYKDWQE